MTEDTVTIVGGEYDSLLRIKFERENRRIHVNAQKVRMFNRRIILQGVDGEKRAIVNENGMTGSATITKTDNRGVVEIGIPKKFYKKIRRKAEELEELRA